MLRLSRVLPLIIAVASSAAMGTANLPSSPFILWMDDDRESLRASPINSSSDDRTIASNLPSIAQIIYEPVNGDIYLLVDDNSPAIKRLSKGGLTFFESINPATSAVRYDPHGHAIVWTDTESDVVRFRNFRGESGILFNIPNLQRAFTLTADGGFYFVTEDEFSDTAVHEYRVQAPTSPITSHSIPTFGSVKDIEFDPLSRHFVYLMDNGAIFAFNIEAGYDDFIHHSPDIEDIGIDAAKNTVYYSEPYVGIQYRAYLPNGDTSPSTFQHDTTAPFLVYPDTLFGINFATPKATVFEEEGVIRGKLVRFDDVHVEDVLLTTHDGTARAGIDYEPVDDWLLFHVNETEIEFTIPLIDNAIPDGSRIFTIRIEDNRGNAPGPYSEMEVTIKNNDIPGKLQFTQDKYVVDEVEASISIPLERIDGEYGSTSIRCTTSDAGALAGVDYESFDEIIAFAHGETSKQIEIGIGADDFQHQGSRKFILTLSNPTDGASLGARSQISVIINDDEAPSSADRSFKLPDDTTGSSGPVLILPDGRVLAVADLGRGFQLKAFLSDGSTDPNFVCPLTFGFNHSLRAIERLADGRLLIAGKNLTGGAYGDSVVRLLADGSVDQSFDYDPSGIDSTDSVGAILPLDDGKVMVGGLLQCQTDASAYLIRINSDGSLDETFPDISLPGFGCPWVYDLKLLETGKILVIGNFSSADGIDGPVVRLNPDGTVDPTFLNELPVDSAAECVLLPDGTIAVSIYGSFLYAGLYILDADGALLRSFRYTTDFSSAKSNTMLPHPNGGLLIGGSFLSRSPAIQSTLIRWHIDGTFEPLGKADVALGIPSNMAFGPLGFLYVSGRFDSFDGKPIPGLARVRIDDTLGLAAWQQWYADGINDIEQLASDGLSYLEHFLYGTLPNQVNASLRAPAPEWFQPAESNDQYLAFRFYRHDLSDVLDLKVFAGSGLQTSDRELIWSSRSDPDFLSDYLVEGDPSQSGWICIRDRLRQHESGSRFMIMQIEETVPE